MDRTGNVRSIEAEMLLREGQQYQENLAYEKALESYQRAAALEPDRAVVHLRIGLVLSKLGRWPDAVTAFLEAIRLDPQQSEAHLNLGFVYYEMGMEECAQAEFELARKLAGLADPPGKMRF
jgi:tetratricopeptide (TPR) repeat protein